MPIKFIQDQGSIMRIFHRQFLDLCQPGGGRIVHLGNVAREWLFLKLSSMALRLGHRVLVAGARAFWSGVIGKAGLRHVLALSLHLDRLGMRLMRRSIGRRRMERRSRHRMR